MLNEDYKAILQALNDLILNKKASGRTRDLADVEALESMQNDKLSNSPEANRH